MKKNKATVYTGRNPVAIEFTNYSSNGASQNDEKIDVENILLVFNCFDLQLRGVSNNSQKFIDGVASEVNHSLASGGLNIYCSFFDSSKEFTRMDLPYEFSTLDDDPVYGNGEKEDMFKTFSLCGKRLKSIKVIGIISSDEIEELKEKISVKLELNSDFLIVT